MHLSTGTYSQSYFRLLRSQNKLQSLGAALGMHIRELHHLQLTDFLDLPNTEFYPFNNPMLPI